MKRTWLVLLMVDASHQEFADGGDGTGQGPVRSSGREAAMGATIFVGGNLFPEQKWWGPVVLDASPKPPSASDFSRESSPPSRAKFDPTPQTIFLQASRMPD